MVDPFVATRRKHRCRFSYTLNATLPIRFRDVQDRRSFGCRRPHTPESPQTDPKHRLQPLEWPLGDRAQVSTRRSSSMRQATWSQPMWDHSLSVSNASSRTVGHGYGRAGFNERILTPHRSCRGSVPGWREGDEPVLHGRAARHRLPPRLRPEPSSVHLLLHP